MCCSLLVSTISIKLGGIDVERMIEYISRTNIISFVVGCYMSLGRRCVCVLVCVWRAHLFGMCHKKPYNVSISIIMIISIVIIITHFIEDGARKKRIFDGIEM